MNLVPCTRKFVNKFLLCCLALLRQNAGRNSNGLNFVPLAIVVIYVSFNSSEGAANINKFNEKLAIVGEFKFLQKVRKDIKR